MTVAPLLIASAPNGAYKTRADHAALPVTPAQLADTAAAVAAAGASMLHLHVRDADGRHTLDAGAYAAAVKKIRARVGDELFIQATSEAAGIYAADEQRRALDAIADAGVADGVSVALRELIRDAADTDAAAELLHRLAAAGVLPQYILYDAADIKCYADLAAVIPAAHSVLLVAGRHDAAAAVSVHDAADGVRRMVAALPATVNWMLCAFGENEFELLTDAVKLGGHARVGFENTLRLNTGAPATDNAQLVTQLVTDGNPTHRPLADAHQTKKILASDSF